jgi:hypothetical protein
MINSEAILNSIGPIIEGENRRAGYKFQTKDIEPYRRPYSLFSVGSYPALPGLYGRAGISQFTNTK